MRRIGVRRRETGSEEEERETGSEEEERETGSEEEGDRE